MLSNQYSIINDATDIIQISSVFPLMSFFGCRIRSRIASSVFWIFSNLWELLRFFLAAGGGRSLRNLDCFWRVLANSFVNESQFGFVWCFLMIQLSLCIFGKISQRSQRSGASQVRRTGKEPACQCRSCKRRRFDFWVGNIPWRRAWKPTLVFLPGECHGLRSLVGYSP